MAPCKASQLASRILIDSTVASNRSVANFTFSIFLAKPSCQHSIAPKQNSRIRRLPLRKGQEILPHYGQEVEIERVRCHPRRLADRNAEKRIREILAQRYEEHGIIGEEFGREREDADFVWVLDPVDGTKSFISGVPLFATLIALLYKGRRSSAPSTSRCSARW